MADILMGKVYWSLGNKKYDSYNEFVKDVTDYNNNISSKGHEWNPEKIIINGPEIIASYEALWKDEDDVLEIMIDAENKSGISMGEILFKINNQSIEFFSEASFFFEGLRKINNDSQIPMYEILIGT